VLPTIVAVPAGEGWWVLMSENVLGAVTFADPICCEPLVLTTVNVKSIV
jgi:hypothetical protein